MDVIIPLPALGMLTLLTFFGPYAVGFLNGVLPFVKKPWQKKLLAVIVAVALAAVALLLYYAFTKEAVADWPTMVLLSIVLVQASYTLVTKSSATAVELKFEAGSSLRRDLR